MSYIKHTGTDVHVGIQIYIPQPTSPFCTILANLYFYLLHWLCNVANLIFQCVNMEYENRFLCALVSTTWIWRTWMSFSYEYERHVNVWWASRNARRERITPKGRWERDPQHEASPRQTIRRWAPRQILITRSNQANAPRNHSTQRQCSSLHDHLPFTVYFIKEIHPHEGNKNSVFHRFRARE